METITISALGAIIGLIIAIVLIFMKVPPVYSLMIGALLGGLSGGANLNETVNLMISGSQGMMTSVLRILAAGVLAGTLIKSGGAESIAQNIIAWIGEKKSILALSIATLLLTSVGVFIDIAVITVAPIALAVAKKANLSRTSILLAMIGGGKAGNIISPNPNTIAISDAFNTSLTSIMFAGIIPAIFGLIITYFISKSLTNKGSAIKDTDLETKDYNRQLPSFFTSMIGPIVAIVILSLRPLLNISIDPMLALPLGGIIGALVMGKARYLLEYISYGLSKMTGVAIILIGTGTIAGIIQNSEIGNVLISTIENLGLPIYILSPLAGILMSAATASTTSGSTVASQVFSETLLGAGVSSIGGGQMIHSGATVLDHLPHGSFFHATAGSVNMRFKERLSIIVFESIVGLSMTIVSIIIFGIIGMA